MILQLEFPLQRFLSRRGMFHITSQSLHSLADGFYITLQTLLSCVHLENILVELFNLITVLLNIEALLTQLGVDSGHITEQFLLIFTFLPHFLGKSQVLLSQMFQTITDITIPGSSFLPLLLNISLQFLNLSLK